MAETLVEILYFEGCPNYVAARELVQRVGAEVGARLDLRVVEVGQPADADRMRFLGSPTIRVDGQDIEPGADEREQFQFACRVYRTEKGFAGQPPAEWVRAALTDR
jgi:hypothetical protein